MRNCDAVEALMTRYVDGEAPEVDRRAVEVHLSTCVPCRTRVAAQVAVRRLVRTRAARARALGVSPPWRPRAIGFSPTRFPSTRRIHLTSPTRQPASPAFSGHAATSP